ncbi:MAG: S41 family peptidase [Thermoguttaceae bacterium]
MQVNKSVLSSVIIFILVALSACSFGSGKPDQKIAGRTEISANCPDCSDCTAHVGSVRPLQLVSTRTETTNTPFSNAQSNCLTSTGESAQFTTPSTVSSRRSSVVFTTPKLPQTTEPEQVADESPSPIVADSVQPTEQVQPELEVQPEVVVEIQVVSPITTEEPIIEQAVVEPESEPTPITTTQPVVEPVVEPVVQPELTSEPESVVQPELEVQPEVVVEIQVVSPITAEEPIVEQAVVEPESEPTPITATQPVVEPIVEPAVQPVVQPELTSEPESVVQPELDVQPEVVVEIQVVSPITTEEPIVEQAVVEPESEPTPITATQPVAEPIVEPIVEPAVQPEVVVEIQVVSPITAEEPIVEQAVVEPESEPTPITATQPVAEPIVEPVVQSVVQPELNTADSGTNLEMKSETTTEPNLTRLLRYPDVHRYDVVFCYGGDLWTVKTKGGVATRLTAHEGQELFPKYSPNGKMIAFTGQYDGDEQVYVIPAEGGIPRQLTYYPASGPLPPRRGYDNIVYGWTPDGESVLFRSMRDSNSVTELGTLYKVSVQGGLPEKLPLPTAGAGDYSPDGKEIVYSPLFRDFRTWKRYEGGWAQNLAIFNLENFTFKEIGVSPRTERDPMWIGKEIYFVSDRNGTLNLYKYDVSTEKVGQITNYDTWDVRWASSDHRSKIIFELGGELKLYNLENGAIRDVPVQVPHDGLAMRPSRYNVSGNIESFSLSPGGKRAAMIARGDLFTVPAEKGTPRNLTQTSGAHDREAVWSADGSRIAYISDQSGEDQLYLVDPKGEKPAEQLTNCFTGMLRSLTWSPNGRFLSVADRGNRLYVVPCEDFTTSGKSGEKEVATEVNGTVGVEFKKGVPVEIVKDRNGGSLEHAWSPCSQYLAVTLSDESGFESITIYDIVTKEQNRVTNWNFDVYSPSWDPNGEYLYYLGRHEFAPQISTLEWNFAGNRNIGIYALALRRDVANLFAPQSDEVEVKKDSSDDCVANQDKKGSTETNLGKVNPSQVELAKTERVEQNQVKESTTESANNETSNKELAKNETGKPGSSQDALKKTKIDFDGLGERVVRVPVSFENYSQLNASKGLLFYVQTGAPFYGRDSYTKPALKMFDLKERKESTISDDMSGLYAMSPDGTRLLVQSGTQLKLYNAQSGTQTPITLQTSELSVDRVPVEEWTEIFNETCRKFRDFFYVENMHGYDWKTICEQYKALLPYVAHRSDLNYLLGEMIAELNVGHAYIQGGDFTIPRRTKVGLPGARLVLDPESNRYRIAKIFKGQNQEPKYRSPLAAIGVDISQGDYVLAIEGKQLEGNENPYRLLQNLTEMVRLTVNDKPTLDGAREVVYQPVENETSLLYLDFVLDRLDRVSKATDNQVGYFHLPDMGAPGAYEFIKWYYPQVRKGGLIVDVRSNGGGNISQWIIMRLNQRLLGTRFGRLRETPTTYPGTVFNGHMICLINETSASDGDIFPYYFRKSGLGLLVGKRTWGGVVGISNCGPLIDGGQVMVPLSGTNDENGHYIIEGVGVSPDIEVANTPKSVIEGKDLQLEKAIEQVLSEMKEHPKSLPDRPADPVKTKEVIPKY